MDKEILYELLYSSLLNKRQKDCVSELYSALESESVDSIYWKDKYYGIWPSDTPESIERHIKILQKRIEELKTNEK